jgi:PKD repeat protein
MNSIRHAVPNSILTARSRRPRLAQAASLFAAVILAAIGCSDVGTGPLSPIRATGYIDSVATDESKAEAVPQDGPAPSASLSAALAADGPMYTVSSVPFAPEAGPFIPPSPHSWGFPGTDDLTFGGGPDEGFPIGFSFMFYGQTYDKFWIASNGAVLFEFIHEGACCNARIPLNDPPKAPPSKINGPRNNLVALAWTDLKPLAGQITWTTRGTAPNRRLIVNFDQVPFFYADGTPVNSRRVTTQAILHEGSNVIEIHTKSQANAGRLVTQGIENRTGTEAAFLAGRNQAVYALANDAVRFTPVNQNAVPTALPGGNAGGPPADHYAAVEGDTITFVGGGYDADGDALTYSWDFDNDAVADATTPTAKWSYADNRTYTATLTVSDGRGGVNHASVDVIVKNAPPTVYAGLGMRINAGESPNFAGKFKDKGVNDALWRWTWNLGPVGDDFGSAETQDVTLVESKRFCKAGSFPVKLTVVDKDGGSGSDEIAVTVDALPLQIDINPNTINLNGTGHGMITVRIFSRPGLDASALSPNSIRLTGGAGKGTQLARTGGGLWQWKADEDLNGDGQFDVTAGFRRDELIANGDLNLQSTELKLVGVLGDCGDVLGKAAVRVKVQAKDKSAASSLQPTGEAATPIDPSNP